MNYELLYKLEVEAFGNLERDYHTLKSNYNREKRVLNAVIESLREQLVTQKAYSKSLEDELEELVSNKTQSTVINKYYYG